MTGGRTKWFDDVVMTMWLQRNREREMMASFILFVYNLLFSLSSTKGVSFAMQRARNRESRIKLAICVASDSIRFIYSPFTGPPIGFHDLFTFRMLPPRSRGRFDISDIALWWLLISCSERTARQINLRCKFECCLYCGSFWWATQRSSHVVVRQANSSRQSDQMTDCICVRCKSSCPLS